MSAKPPDETAPAAADDVATPRRPTADEIEVPESWQVEQDDDEGADAEDPDTRRRRGPREALTGRVARGAGRCMFVVDRLLLVIALGGPLLILGYQSLEWLRSSVWPPMPVAQVFVWLQTDASGFLSAQWPGLNRAVNWLLAQPLTLFLLVAGLLLHVLSGLVFPRSPPD